MFNRGQSVLIILLILVITSLSGYIYIFMNNDTQPEYTSSSLFERIVPIQEVALVKYHYTGVVGYQDSKSFQSINIPLTKKYFLVKYDGYIKAGVDLQEINVAVTGEKVHIELPHAIIMENVIDERSLVVYDQSMNVLNQLKIEDYNQAIIDDKYKMEKEAIERGILLQAEEQAELMIRSIMKDMPFQEVSIVSVKGPS